MYWNQRIKDGEKLATFSVVVSAMDVVVPDSLVRQSVVDVVGGSVLDNSHAANLRDGGNDSFVGRIWYGRGVLVGGGAPTGD